jgi:hypothetical protein
MHYSLEPSDMFRRFLLLSVLEKIPENLIKKKTRKDK